MFCSRWLATLMGLNSNALEFKTGKPIPPRGEIRLRNQFFAIKRIICEIEDTTKIVYVKARQNEAF